jgi:uncharacterized RDD family membrane protein YckC
MNATTEQTELRYAGFWPRFAAGMIDVLVAGVFVWPLVWAAGRSRELSILVPTTLFVSTTAIYLFLVVRYGGEPGKLVMGLRIALVDGSAVTWRAAVLRVAVGILLSALDEILAAHATMQIPHSEFIALSFLERTHRIGEITGDMGRYLQYAGSVWGSAELLTLLFNKRRRSLHDFIAGTVVVHRDRSEMRSRQTQGELT